QVMKDKKGTIRQVIAANNENVRLFFAEYYPNGQLMANLPLDDLGKFNGHAVYYYENGSLKSEGNFNHGLATGEWNNYSKNGKVSGIDHYDENGQLISTEKSGKGN
ncbi:MAG TPA: hypothetical protein VLJ68_09015, partial [Chitinophagaceae bacterium]|nr:hypothetical protein [Chitinophagaceae bacterium]